MKQNTIIIPIIRPDFIERMLFTLYQFTEAGSFNIIVIDQTGTREAQDKCGKYAHLWISSYRNLGFSKAMNTGIVLSQTPYITLANDDIEFMNNRWWQGILDTFAMDEKIIAVNPMSAKEGAWGWGLTGENKDTWIPPEGFMKDPDDPTAVVPNYQGKPFTKEDGETKEGYDFLINNHPKWQKDTVCDGIAMWFPVFKKEGMEKVGLLDEKFYPSRGEDYDYNCRAYSQGYRMVGTTKSWLYHAWGKSTQVLSEGNNSKLFSSRPHWNNNNELWGDKFDIWGMEHLPDGTKKPLVRKVPVFIDEL